MRSFFVVLAGSVTIVERQVSHLESASEEAAKMRQTEIRPGKSFHHLPLIFQAQFYGYSARVTNPLGASVANVFWSLDREPTPV